MSKDILDSENNIYLEVPFDEKDECKNMGAWWNSKKKKWFINEWT